jgi:hypothetical protein
MYQPAFAIYITLDFTYERPPTMKIRTGVFDLLESGFVNSLTMEDLEFTLNEAPRMVVVLKIKKSPSPEAVIELNVEANDRLAITYTNPAVQLNFGSQNPIKLGSMNARELSAAIRVTIIGDYSSYQVAYSFFLGEAEK